MIVRSKDQLHAYQDSAITYLFENDEALALLPTGSGKTVIGWTAAVELMDAGEVRHPLVFAPIRVACIEWPDQRHGWEHLKDRPIVEWGGEPKTWAPSLWRESRILWGRRTHAEQRLPNIRDTIKRRELQASLKAISAEEKRVNKALQKLEPANAVHVTSYENLMWLCDLYAPGESPFDLWIFDEISKLRNPKSPRYKAVVKHAPKARIRWGLMASPAPESIENLFAPVRIVDGGKLWGSSFYAWRQKFFTPADFMGYEWRPQLGAFDMLMDDLNKVAFKAPEELLTYQRSIAHSQILVDMPALARAIYRDMEKEMAAVLAGGDDIVAMSAAAVSMKLRQIANGFIYDVVDGKRVVHRLHDGKTEALAELIDSMGREPLLVAYEFEEDLASIQRIWKNVPYLGAGVSSTRAREHIERWNKRELPVLAIHPLSAGHGINLQHGGSHIAWLSLPWALESYEQTNARLDRQGQTRACFGHHLICRDTIDQRVSDVLLEKDASQQKVIVAIRRV